MTQLLINQRLKCTLTKSGDFAKRGFIRRKFSFVVLLVFAFIMEPCFPQTSRHKYYREAAITEEIQKEDIPEGGLNQAYSFIGLYKKANAQFDIFPDTLYMKIHNGGNYANINAFPLINKILKSKEIVIINEAHDFPQNRLFLYKILDSLKAIGFSDIFMETFNEKDTLFQRLKYPTIQTGAYSRELIYGEAIRKMAKMNYRLYEYEKDYDLKLDTQQINGKSFAISKNTADWIPIEMDSFVTHFFLLDKADREILQAFNIYHKLQANKISKAIVFCGYYHEYKETWTRAEMAKILTHLIQKSPYVINQTIVREHSLPKFEHPFYQKVRASKTKNFGIITDLKLNPIPIVSYGNPQDTVLDLLVSAPLSVYKNNRPTWLEMFGEKKRYALHKIINPSYLLEDCLVLVYLENEYKQLQNKAIPVDVFQYYASAGHHDLILRPKTAFKIFLVKKGIDILSVDYFSK